MPAKRQPSIFSLVYADPASFPAAFKELYAIHDAAAPGSRERRVALYDLYFLGCIAVMAGHKGPVVIEGKTLNSLVYQSGEKDKKLSFFLEDIYVDDLNIFVKEYGKFHKSKRSKLFFQSNLVNFALNMMCYNNMCFDSFLLSLKVKKPVIKTIYQKFLSKREELISALLAAYESYGYTDVLRLYKAYIEYYDLAMHMVLPGSKDYKFLKEKPPTFLGEQAEMRVEDLLDQIYYPTPGKYVYLSFNLVNEYKFARFLMTQFIVSFVNSMKPVHQGLYDTILVIAHDFRSHGMQHRNSTTSNRKDFRSFLLSLYNSGDRELYEEGAKSLQILQMEILLTEVLTLSDAYDILTTGRARGKNYESRPQIFHDDKLYTETNYADQSSWANPAVALRFLASLKGHLKLKANKRK